MQKANIRPKEVSLQLPLTQMNSAGSSTPKLTGSSQVVNTAINSTGTFVPNMPEPLTNPAFISRPSVAKLCRPDGKHYRAITPLEAIYYHERLDLITHPLIKGNLFFIYCCEQ